MGLERMLRKATREDERPEVVTKKDLAQAIEEAFLMGWESRGAALDCDGKDSSHYAHHLAMVLSRWEGRVTRAVEWAEQMADNMRGWR